MCLDCYLLRGFTSKSNIPNSCPLCDSTVIQRLLEHTRERHMSQAGPPKTGPRLVWQVPVSFFFFLLEITQSKFKLKQILWGGLCTGGAAWVAMCKSGTRCLLNNKWYRDAVCWIISDTEKPFVYYVLTFSWIGLFFELKEEQIRAKIYNVSYT